MKLGMDPTAPDLHLGDSITLKKLRDFQRRGHTVIFLVGDFTADDWRSAGRSETRKPLSHEQIEANARTYQEQAAQDSGSGQDGGSLQQRMDESTRHAGLDWDRREVERGTNAQARRFEKRLEKQDHFPARAALSANPGL